MISSHKSNKFLNSYNSIPTGEMEAFRPPSPPKKKTKTIVTKQKQSSLKLCIHQCMGEIIWGRCLGNKQLNLTQDTLHFRLFGTQISRLKYLLFFNLKSEFWDPGLLTLPFETCSSGSQDCLDVSFGFRLQSMKTDSANEFIWGILVLVLLWVNVAESQQFPSQAH